MEVLHQLYIYTVRRQQHGLTVIGPHSFNWDLFLSNFFCSLCLQQLVSSVGNLFSSQKIDRRFQFYVAKLLLAFTFCWYSQSAWRVEPRLDLGC